ncbi:MAG: hypothetical protein Q4C70_02060 [Planctomycetia bacterium]|nr:hypothetical protein [Planctomycetia bacterium]
MKTNLPCTKYLLGILAASLFFLLATTLTAGFSGLLFLVGDTGAGAVFGWIAAFFGLIFFGLFFLLAFSFFGLSLLPEVTNKSVMEEKMKTDVEMKNEMETRTEVETEIKTEVKTGTEAEM